MTWIVSFCIIFVLIIKSVGSNNNIFGVCKQLCIENSCTIAAEKETPADNGDLMSQQTWSHKLLQWSCTDECQYKCMWVDVMELIEKKEDIKKYYGKWPFIAVLGMQELFSSVFSALHGVGNILMLIRLKKKVPSDAPMYKVIYWYAIVNTNAWIWSTAFHARDVVFTEKMDYYCAVSLVLYSVFTLCARLIYTSKRRKWWWLPATCAAIFLYYCRHIYYLEMISFNYDYNMKVLITIGVINGTGWLLFCFANLKKLPHVKMCLLSGGITYFFLFFEIYDFPPLFWLIDAHAIWHGGTIPVPVLFLGFLIEDSLLLHKINNQKSILLQWTDNDNLEVVIHKHNEKTNGYALSHSTSLNNNANIYIRMKSL